MRVSVNWLKKYTAIDVPADELVRKIGAQLGAVEEVIDLGARYKGITIVEITQAAPHPNADRLNIYQMFDGKQQVQVVSGDQTLQVGDKVGWIAPGQTVPSTFDSAEPAIMEARPLRGEISHGMFGSGRELGINDDHEGVLKLDTNQPAGTLLAAAYELDDTIIDIENKMFTHRPDCFGLLGVAREATGIQGKQFVSPDWYLHEAHRLLRAEAEPLPFEVTNRIPGLVPAYHLASIRDVEIKPSSLVTQSYLKRVGLRPINNVVDATNYLMYLTAQPLHAFDYDKVVRAGGGKSAHIVVRHPLSGEKLTLLDGRTIEPHSGAMLICSNHTPIALGGMMGGQETEVDRATKNILLECATFDMYTIRRSAMHHGIFTDAVTRFNKGQSPEQCGVVLGEAINALRDWAGGGLASEVTLPAPHSHKTILIDEHFINSRLGTKLTRQAIAHRLGLVEVGSVDTLAKEAKLQIVPPFWRMDLLTPEDIVEEIGRLHGYDSLPQTLPLRSTVAVNPEPIELLNHKICSALRAAGNNELQTYSFVPSKLFTKTGQDSSAAYRLRNALSPELELVRTSLLPSLLEKVHSNHKAGYPQFGLFEFGKTHNKHELAGDSLGVTSSPLVREDMSLNGGGLAGQTGLPYERLALGYVFSAEPKAATHFAGAPFYQAKYVLDYVLRRLRTQVTFQPLTNATLHAWWLKNLAVLFEPQRAALIMLDKEPLGIIGEFTSSVRIPLKLPGFIAGFELDRQVLLNAYHHDSSNYQPLSRFPAADQDVCFKVANDVTYGAVEQIMYASLAADQRLRLTITPVSIFRRNDDAARKQLTYHLTLQHHDRTLKTNEVNQLISHMARKVAETTGAERI